MGVPLKKQLAHPKILAGWKSIANYMGMGVRSVQRYESQYSLPIRRIAGGPKGAVIATIAELDAWTLAAPLRNTFKLPSARPDIGSSIVELKRSLTEMRQLKEEMRMLREKHHLLIEALHTNMLTVDLGDAPPRKKPANVIYFDGPKKIN